MFPFIIITVPIGEHILFQVFAPEHAADPSVFSSNVLGVSFGQEYDGWKQVISPELALASIQRMYPEATNIKWDIAWGGASGKLPIFDEALEIVKNARKVADEAVACVRHAVQALHRVASGQRTYLGPD